MIMKLSTNLFKPLSALLNGFFVAFSYNLIILAVILNYYINYLNIFIMDSTSLTVITLWILGSFVFLAFIYSVWAFVYFRGMAEKAREKGCAFEKDVNMEKIKLFYCYRGKFVTVDCDGDDVRAPYFTNENGTEICLLSEVEREIFIGGLTPDSMVPNKAYRLAVDKTCLKHNDDGTTYTPNTLQVFFQPAKNDISNWTVTEIEKRDLILEHPLMGKLRVPKRFNKDAQIGQMMTLISEVTEIGNSYRLEYKPVS